MAISQADIDNIDRLIASGVRSVTNADTTVINNTTESLMKARANLVALLNAQNAAVSNRPRQTYAYQSGRGYGYDDC